LVRYGHELLLETLHLLLVNGHSSSRGIKVFALTTHSFFRRGLLLGCLDGLLDSELEILNFVVDEVLIDFHFLFEIAHLALVDQGENAGTGVFNGLHTPLLQIKHFLSNQSLEVAIRYVLDLLSLHMEVGGLGAHHLQTLEVASQERGDIVELVILVEERDALDADAGLVVDAVEVQRLAMETAVNGDDFVAADVLHIHGKQSSRRETSTHHGLVEAMRPRLVAAGVGRDFGL
jgi:hypothetical protein